MISSISQNEKKILTTEVKPDIVISEVKDMEQKPELVNKALGIFMDKDGAWYVARIRYNGQTGDTGSIEKISDPCSRIEVEQRFKIKVIEEGIF